MMKSVSKQSTGKKKAAKVSEKSVPGITIKVGLPSSPATSLYPFFVLWTSFFSHYCVHSVHPSPFPTGEREAHPSLPPLPGLSMDGGEEGGKEALSSHPPVAKEGVGKEQRQCTQFL